MRSVSGEVLSSCSISLSKATKIISKFVSAETGASQAVCAYLRRASASFSELNHLHKELKSERQKHRKPKSEITEENRTRSFGDGLSREPSGGDVEGEKKKNKKKRKGDFGNFRDKEDEIGMGVEGEENLTRTVALLSQQPSHGVEDSERKNQKMIKKKKKKEKGEVGNFVENQGEIEKRDGKGERGIEEKRIKVEDGVTLDSTKKKEIDHFGDNGVKEEREGGRKMGSEEKGEERKKMRKSVEVEEGGVDDDSEQRRKKKKKRSKIDGEN